MTLLDFVRIHSMTPCEKNGIVGGINGYDVEVSVHGKTFHLALKANLEQHGEFLI